MDSFNGNGSAARPRGSAVTSGTAPAPDDLPWLPLADLARGLASGAVSSLEIVSACLARIAALDSRLHAFVDVYRDEALGAARHADRERAAGRICGPLHGLPVAIKDLAHIRGRITTAGSKARPPGLAYDTASAWERLRAVGMIALGKTHLVEFAFGGWGRNEPLGAPWNPWDTRIHRVAGGSSSGSAVAVAGGLAPIALGTDTGGSIRIPSALCGLTGLKPTYGLVSLAGVFPLATTLDSVGPLARSAEDAGLVLAALAGPDPRDAATLRAPAVDFTAALAGAADIRGLRVSALPVEQFQTPATADVLRARDEMLAVLRALGAEVEEIQVPIDFEAVMLRNGRLIAAEAWALHRDYIEDETLPFDPWVRRRILGGRSITADDYRELLAAQTRAAADYATWMRGRDALLTPTLPITATPLDAVDEATTPLATFTRAANFLGACALSLPAGISADGLPIGMQLMGAPFADATLVRLGRAYQGATEWHRRRPDLSAWNG
jgi:aspartyl-tRNA(Asn)/glutamyl-tRNA(Gln) amidotransferase subunit A